MNQVIARTENAALPSVTTERGERAVFCGLTSIIWLHRRIQDAFSWWWVNLCTPLAVCRGCDDFC